VLRIKALTGFNIQDKGMPCEPPCSFNFGKRQYVRQDKFEIRISSRKVKNTEIWWGFRVRKASDFRDSAYGSQNCHAINFAQYKNQPYKLVGLQYTKNTYGIGGTWGEDLTNTGHFASAGFRRKDGLPFSIDPLIIKEAKQSMISSGWKWNKFIQVEKPTSIAGTVFNPKITPYNHGRCGQVIMPGFAPMFTTDKWTNYKIGIYSTSSKNGWVQVYQNGNLMHYYSGRTFHNDPNWSHYSQIALGLYRQFRVGNNVEQALEFDDFVASGVEAVIDGYLD